MYFGMGFAGIVERVKTRLQISEVGDPWRACIKRKNNTIYELNQVVLYEAAAGPPR